MFLVAERRGRFRRVETRLWALTGDRALSSAVVVYGGGGEIPGMRRKSLRGGSLLAAADFHTAGPDATHEQQKHGE